MAQSVLAGTIQSLANLGLYDVILPFLLIFVISYGVLTKTKILGEGSENLNAMFAFVFGFIVVAFANIVQIINAFLANMALILVIIIGFLLLVGMLLGDKESLDDIFPSNYRKALVVVLFIVTIFVILGITGALDWIYRAIGHSNIGPLITNLIILIIFFGILYWIVKGAGPSRNDDSD